MSLRQSPGSPVSEVDGNGFVDHVLTVSQYTLNNTENALGVSLPSTYSGYQGSEFYFEITLDKQEVQNLISINRKDEVSVEKEGSKYKLTSRVGIQKTVCAYIQQHHRSKIRVKLKYRYVISISDLGMHQGDVFVEVAGLEVDLEISASEFNNIYHALVETAKLAQTG
uniref:Uncharacterized protein n=1 Tax=Timema shepardi TaxID=629360 RepID=A0A7R9ATC3_TIMSH|nr:unnamed protein product [Timema shepardi]